MSKVIKKWSQVISFSHAYYIRFFSLPLKVIGGFLLVIGILAITDNENVHANPGVAPIGVGFLVTGVIASFSLNQFALNPALDIPGRVMLSITGGGVEPFRYFVDKCLLYF